MYHHHGCCFFFLSSALFEFVSHHFSPSLNAGLYQMVVFPLQFAKLNIIPEKFSCLDFGLKKTTTFTRRCGRFGSWLYSYSIFHMYICTYLNRCVRVCADSISVCHFSFYPSSSYATTTVAAVIVAQSLCTKFYTLGQLQQLHTYIGIRVVYKFIANNEGMKYLSGRFKWWFCALFFSFHLTTWKPIRFFLLFSSSSYCSFQWPLHLLLQIHSINFSDSWLKYIKLIVWFFGCMFVHLTGSFYWNHWWVVHSPPSFTASRVPFYLNGCI